MPPRQLDPKIPRDLETIVLKALSKDPSHRFADRRGNGRRIAAIRREPADPFPADPVLSAVLAVVQAEPLAGRGQRHRRDADDGSRRRLDFAAFIYRDRNERDRSRTIGGSSRGEPTP